MVLWDLISSNLRKIDESLIRIAVDRCGNYFISFRTRSAITKPNIERNDDLSTLRIRKASLERIVVSLVYYLNTRKSFPSTVLLLNYFIKLMWSLWVNYYKWESLFVFDVFGVICVEYIGRFHSIHERQICFPLLAVPISFKKREKKYQTFKYF